MKPTIEVYCVGYKGEPVTYSALLRTQSPDGTEFEFEMAKSIVGDMTKNQVDLVSIVMALRCIKPESRDWEVLLYAPPGYACRATEKDVDGRWRMNPKSNLEIINDVREAIGLFPNITIDKNKAGKMLTRCLGLAKQACQNAT